MVGTAAFVVFALGLEQLAHLLVLKPAPDGSIALMNQPFLYVLYVIFTAASLRKAPVCLLPAAPPTVCFPGVTPPEV
jgi:uncharacterized membrane protein YhfC